jgi:predicted aspartyl protease
MRIVLALALASCLLCSRAFSQSSDGGYKSLYEGHHWFALRDATTSSDAPAFYHAAVEAAFEEEASAERDLSSIIARAPHSADAYEAQELLTTFFFRHGEFKQGLLHLQAMLKEKPDSEDVKNAIGIYTAMGQVDQSVVEVGSSTVQMLRGEGNLYLPVNINGQHASYAFDTGANFNGISESEATRLGMKLVEASGQVEDSSGHQLGLRVAIAKDLRIGGLHLRDVAFGVFPDGQPPFNELSQQKRGLIGIPILLAMRTMRWSTDGIFELGFPSEAFHLQTANLSFEQAFPVTRGFFRGKGIDLTVDSGAQRTVLSPAFASAFSDVLAPIAKPENYKLTGVGGTSSYASLLVPSLDLQIGGHTVTLTNAHVLTQESSNESKWAGGNLGIDLLNEANSTTFDFGAMKLTLR